MIHRNFITILSDQVLQIGGEEKVFHRRQLLILNAILRWSTAEATVYLMSCRRARRAGGLDPSRIVGLFKGGR